MKGKTVQIQTKILHSIPDKIGNLKMDVLVFFLSLFRNTPHPLPSKILKRYHDNYNRYIDFLLDNELIIKVKEYGADIKRSRIYQLNPTLISDLTTYTIKDKPLLKKINKGYTVRGFEYLTQYFNDNLTIDPLPKDLQNYRNNQIQIEITNKEYFFSHNPDTDSRLHTTLTKSAKVIRPFIKYDGDNLVMIDIVSSQPYFLAVVINALLSKDEEVLQTYGISKKITLEETTDSRLFIEKVLDGTLYDFELDIQYEDEKPFRILNNKFSKSAKYLPQKEKVYYKSERHLKKAVVMESLFSNIKSTNKEVVIFRRQYPNVFKLKNNLDFYKTLSRMESKFILSIVGKTISKKYPIFTIHDALLCKRSDSEQIKQEFINILSDTNKIIPKLLVK